MKPLKFMFILSAVVATSVICSGCGVQPQPVDPNLEKIAMTRKPTKTNYIVGEKFNPAGMKITATYNDGSTNVVSDYLYEPYGKLTLDDTKIRITYYGQETFCPINVREQQDDNPYYADIDPDADGNDLLNQLNSLNSKKRTKTVGYKAMLNNPSSGFYVTDPGTGSNTITTFYSGRNNKGTGGLNREHVWPNSKGGNYVENDIHMPRPTLQKENGSRGNSFYVEGKCDTKKGWDPAMEDFGMESYRGDSARIIFYCAIADKRLTLVDKETDTDSNNTMGKLSDLLKWNLEYSVLEREQIRNDGAESLQGNRNPFIDHPEYACKIWGNTNANTKRICGM